MAADDNREHHKGRHIDVVDVLLVLALLLATIARGDQVADLQREH
jgi:hypothetical protein